MRINARLDQEYINKLEYLKHQEHLTTTETIKNALVYYYEMKNQDNHSKIQKLLNSDFIACEENSENYKKEKIKSLNKKH